jgi:hypothetical protein
MISMLGDVVALARKTLGTGFLDLGEEVGPIVTCLVDRVNGGLDSKVATEMMMTDDIVALVGRRLRVGAIWIECGGPHDGWLVGPSRASGSGLVGGGFPAATPPSRLRRREETRKTIREDVLDARAMPHGEIVLEQLVVPGLRHEVELWLSVQVDQRLVVRVEMKVTTIDEMMEARERVDHG